LHHVGISGFRIDDETYDFGDQQTNVATRFVEQTNALRNGLLDLITRTGLGVYILEIRSDEEIIGTLFEENR